MILFSNTFLSQHPWPSSLPVWLPLPHFVFPLDALTTTLILFLDITVSQGLVLGPLFFISSHPYTTWPLISCCLQGKGSIAQHDLRVPHTRAPLCPVICFLFFIVPSFKAHWPIFPCVPIYHQSYHFQHLFMLFFLPRDPFYSLPCIQICLIFQGPAQSLPTPGDCLW